MCHKIRCDGESWKLFGFQGELNKALVIIIVPDARQKAKRLHSTNMEETSKDLQDAVKVPPYFQTENRFINQQKTTQTMWLLYNKMH